MHAPMSSSHLHLVRDRNQDQPHPPKATGSTIRCYDYDVVRETNFTDAAIFQQVRFFIERDSIYVDGEWWAWVPHKRLFDSLGEAAPLSTIKDSLGRLRRYGLLHYRQNLNASPFDRRGWYAVNEEALAKLRKKPESPVSTDERQNLPSMRGIEVTPAPRWRISLPPMGPKYLPSMGPKYLPSYKEGSARAVFEERSIKPRVKTEECDLISDSCSENAREAEIVPSPQPEASTMSTNDEPEQPVSETLPALPELPMDDFMEAMTAAYRQLKGGADHWTIDTKSENLIKRDYLRTYTQKELLAYFGYVGCPLSTGPWWDKGDKKSRFFNQCSDSTYLFRDYVIERYMPYVKQWLADGGPKSDYQTQMEEEARFIEEEGRRMNAQARGYGDSIDAEFEIL